MIMTNFFCGMAVVSLVAYSRLKDMVELNVNKRKVNVNFEIEEQETERDEKDETDEDDHEREETEIEDDFLVPDVLVPVSMDPLETTSCESRDFWDAEFKLMSVFVQYYPSKGFRVSPCIWFFPFLRQSGPMCRIAAFIIYFIPLIVLVVRKGFIELILWHNVIEFLFRL